ncbi:hypothetical protein [Dyadobacter jiangsuensis]|uniref:hypothetical protein n=1 Tax=Dyadobacter jiangsuensis TaxID=1591085 RepID=UPI000D0CFB19|nr:hypothetical protein [Dyadobacter jiangsuensis]
MSEALDIGLTLSRCLTFETNVLGKNRRNCISLGGDSFCLLPFGAASVFSLLIWWGYLVRRMLAAKASKGINRRFLSLLHGDWDRINLIIHRFAYVEKFPFATLPLLGFLQLPIVGSMKWI